MRSFIVLAHSQKTRLPIRCGLLTACLLVCNSPYAHADTPPQPITCDNLSVSLSDDKNFYIFTVAASGNADAIVGYNFNFGDHQSYQLGFKTTPNQDRHTASVTHVYQKAGIYNAAAQVRAKNGDKTISVPSPNCTTSITIGQPAALPSAGSQYTPEVFASVFIASTLGHYIWRRRFVKL